MKASRLEFSSYNFHVKFFITIQQSAKFAKNLNKQSAKLNPHGKSKFRNEAIREI